MRLDTTNYFTDASVHNVNRIKTANENNLHEYTIIT